MELEASFVPYLDTVWRIADVCFLLRRKCALLPSPTSLKAASPRATFPKLQTRQILKDSTELVTSIQADSRLAVLCCPEAPEARRQELMRMLKCSAQNSALVLWRDHLYHLGSQASNSKCISSETPGGCWRQQCQGRIHVSIHNKAKVWFDDSKPQSHGKSESHGKRSWSAGVPEVAHSRSANRRQVTSRTCSSHFLRPTGMKSWSLRFLLHLSKRHLEDLERPFLAPFQYDVHSLGREGRPGHSKQRHCDHDHVDSA